jgi:hypothetical protein
MNILGQLQELDALIVAHTQPPVTAMLRNRLSPIIEQAEAQADAVAKQDHTLSEQIKAIEALMKENASLKAETPDIVVRNLCPMEPPPTLI